MIRSLQPQQLRRALPGFGLAAVVMVAAMLGTSYASIYHGFVYAAGRAYDPAAIAERAQRGEPVRFEYVSSSLTQEHVRISNPSHRRPPGAAILPADQPEQPHVFIGIQVRAV